MIIQFIVVSCVDIDYATGIDIHECIIDGRLY